MNPKPTEKECHLVLAQVSSGFDFPHALAGGGAARLYGSSRKWSGDIDILVEDKHLVKARRHLEWNLGAVEQDRRTFLISVVNIDLLEPRDDFEREAVGRAVRIWVRDTEVPIVCSDDLVLMKARAGREKDLEDIVRIVRTVGFSEEAASEARKMGLWEGLRMLLKRAQWQGHLE